LKHEPEAGEPVCSRANDENAGCAAQSRVVVQAAIRHIASINDDTMKQSSIGTPR